MVPALTDARQKHRQGRLRYVGFVAHHGGQTEAGYYRAYLLDIREWRVGPPSSRATLPGKVWPMALAALCVKMLFLEACARQRRGPYLRCGRFVTATGFDTICCVACWCVTYSSSTISKTTLPCHTFHAKRFATASPVDPRVLWQHNHASNTRTLGWSGNPIPVHAVPLADEEPLRYIS